MKEFYRAMGERLSTLRIKQKMTRQELAEKVEISDRFVYDLETGKKGCSAEILFRLSRALGVTTDFILTGHDFFLKNGLTPEADEIMQLVSVLPQEALPYVDGMVRSFVRYVTLQERQGG